MPLLWKRWPYLVTVVATFTSVGLMSGLFALPRPDRTSAAPVHAQRIVETPTTEETKEPKASKKETKMAAAAPAPRAAAPVYRAPAPAPYVPASYQSTSSADKIALLVGVNNAPGSTPLEGSTTDVHNMQKALLRYGFKTQNIHVLTEGKASRNGILNGLSSLAARSRSKGIAVFLLATHSGSSGGDMTFATGGGGRISRHELASKLGQVKGRLWSMLPTCYSAAYGIPGVVGKNRIAIFSSAAGEYTYQVGGAGSWLVLYMVKYAMIEGKAPVSVESAFRWAKKKLGADAPGREPIMSDSISGDLVLGKMPASTPPVVAAAKPKPPVTTTAPTPVPVPTTSPTSCGLLGGLFGC